MRDPGFDVDLYVSASVQTLAEVWLGNDTIRAAGQGGVSGRDAVLPHESGYYEAASRSEEDIRGATRVSEKVPNAEASKGSKNAAFRNRKFAAIVISRVPNRRRAIMGDRPETGTGGCLCGAVRYQAVGEPVVTGHCHCADCRRHNGAPVVTLVIFEADKVRFTAGERKIYQSSPGIGRAFCDQCGTPLTIESETGDPRTIEFHISTFDDPDAYVPSLHWYHSRRLAWFDVADNLPRYRGLDSDGEEPYRHGPTTEGLPVGT